MRDRQKLLTWLLCLACAFLISPALFATPELQFSPVNASLNAERDEYGTNKVPAERPVLKAKDGRLRVIVELDDAPVATYRGQLPALKATDRSVTGERKLNLKSRAALSYRSFLQGRQDTFAQAMRQIDPGMRVNRQYQVIFNGMAVEVHPSQLAALQAMPGVKKVYPEKMYYQTMDASLDLVNAPAFWSQLGGQANAGAGVIVAVIDGGIRPENPMFDDVGFTAPAGYPLVDDYCGAVDASFCNDKLIAARHYPPASLHPDEYLSPLGFNGHGTHTAGTSVGNAVVADAGDGVPESISGVAPGAWLMVYKGLWWNGTTGSGASAGLLAALEDAVTDGADVINNSWGGPGGERPSDDVFGGAVDAATAAGVVVVASAGNAGSGAESIGCPACHENAVTVGNSTTNRMHALSFDVTGGPSDLGALEGTGVPLGASVGPATIVWAGSVGDVEGCSAFPAGSMSGAIALISRGSCSFITKVLNAEAAGATYAMVYNNLGGAPITMGGLSAGETISSAMLSIDAGEAVRDHVLANPGATGTVNYPVARVTNDAWEDIVASSSSRGPNGDPDVLKPDIIAPGTRILSAYSPDRGGDFAFLSGTSMSGPHVAGAAALVLQQNPTWTPAQVKTALTSTSVLGLLKEDAATTADPFDIGAGRLDLDRASQAGATFDKPSMADSVCVLGCDFTRTLQNELGSTTTWTASVETSSAGLGITVTPSSLTLGSGDSASFDVAVDTSLVAAGQWHFGAVVWSDASGTAPSARLPIAVFADSSTDTAQFNKTVDKAVAAQNDTLTYEISISNLTYTDPIDLIDFIPDNTTYVPGSAQATVGGAPDPTFAYDAGQNAMVWSGQLDPLTLQLTPSSAPFGYIPLSFFTGPLPCSSVCDDTSITLGGVNFDYAGTNYSSLVMSSNGFFVAGSDSTGAFTPSNQQLPSPAAPNNVIAPLWTDLDMDGTSATDSGAGIWYAAFLSAGPRTFVVLEWQNAQLFGVPGSAFTAQVWIEQGTSNIWFTYASIPFLPSGLTVGIEDSTGAAGVSRYYNGTGTAPAVGSDLLVGTSPGELATFTFQVDTDCSLDTVVNVAEITSGASSAIAFAATEKVPGEDADNDGLPDECSDLCPGTAIPEGVPTVGLNPNHYALVDGDTTFDAGAGTSVGDVFTTIDTGGCSCEQIIDIVGLGEGHTQHGCSVGAMRNWVDSIN